ncbi:hypothetical protein [Ehrlichia ruminantium]|nr:hypothetical protein [Ehrlichia ruminantium]
MNYDTLNLYEYHGIYNDVDYVYDSELSEEYMSYQAIWKAVILQAIIDSTSNYKRMENKIEKIKASNWFNDYSEDFVTVCHFAGYSALTVQTKAKRIISNSKK